MTRTAISTAGSNAVNRPRILIVGAGFGGLFAAQGARDAPPPTSPIVDRHNYHLFQPLLYQVATAGLPPSDIAVADPLILHRQRTRGTARRGPRASTRHARRRDSRERTSPYDYLVARDRLARIRTSATTIGARSRRA